MSIASNWKTINCAISALSQVIGGTDELYRRYATHWITERLKADPASEFEWWLIKYQGRVHRVEGFTTSYQRTPRAITVDQWNFDYLTVVLFNETGEVDMYSTVHLSAVQSIAVRHENTRCWSVLLTAPFLKLRNVNQIDRLLGINGAKDGKADVVPMRSRGFKKLEQIEAWSLDPYCAPFRMICAYLDLADSGDVLKSDLLDLCTDSVNHSELHVPGFDRVFRSMTTDVGDNLGKVFLEDHGYVYMYPQVMKEIEAWFLEDEKNKNRIFLVENECKKRISRITHVRHCFWDCGDVYIFQGTEEWCGSDELHMMTWDQLLQMDDTLIEVSRLPRNMKMTRFSHGNCLFKDWWYKEKMVEETVMI